MTDGWDGGSSQEYEQYWAEQRAKDDRESASPSEPRTHNFLARIERAQVLGGLLQSQENLLDDLHKYFAAEPRRDEKGG